MNFPNMKSFLRKNSFYSQVKKNFGFLKTTKPLLKTFNVDELPEKDSEINMRLNSKRTYTKWFNPNSFDPRAPDYHESVRGDWRQDPTREDFGESKINFI
jgi:hypothetical protein